MELVRYGSSLTTDTANAILTVVSSAQKSTQLVDRIAESAQYQSQSLRQLTQGMDQISEVVLTNASTA